MALSAHFYVHPWDLYDIGVEIALDRILEVGVGGLVLAMAHPTLCAVSPMNPFRTVYYSEDGAVYFHPQSSFYSWTPMKAKASRETEDPEYIFFLMEQIRARKMTTWAWLQYGWNNRLAREHPRSARVDAFGNPHIAQMSPSSRNFRLYCQGMTEDLLEALDPDSVVVEGLGYYPWDHGLPNRQALVSLTPYQAFLLSLDFSDGVASIARKYQVPIDDLQGQIAAYLQNALRREPTEEERNQEVTEKFLEDKFDGLLSRYLVAREAAASLLLENVCRQVRGRKKPVTYAGSTDPLETGLDLFRVRKTVDRYLVKLTDDVRELEEAVRSLRERILPSSEIIARVDPSDYPSEDGLVMTLKAMREHGVQGFAFYNFGLLRPLHLKWLETAREIWEGEG